MCMASNDAVVHTIIATITMASNGAMYGIKSNSNVCNCLRVTLAAPIERFNPTQCKPCKNRRKKA